MRLRRLSCCLWPALLTACQPADAPSKNAPPPKAAAAAPASAPSSRPTLSPSERAQRRADNAARIRASLPEEPTAANADFLKRPAPTGSGPVLRVMTYNIKWDSIFRDAPDSRTPAFARVFNAVAPDIAGLQEIGKHDPAQTAALFDEIAPLPDGGKWHVYRGSKAAIVSKYPFRFTSDKAAHETHRNPSVAWIDLPDDRFPADIMIVNNHFKCCDGEKNDPVRQIQTDATIAWVRDARTPGENIDLPPNSGIVLLGDLNLVGGKGPLETMIAGDIQNEADWGPDLQPDWDDTPLTAAHPRHNGIGPDYTWRNDPDGWKPGRLDYIVYTDAALSERNTFILNCATLSDDALAAAGLEKADTSFNLEQNEFDHLPLVIDFELRGPSTAGRN